MELKKTDIGRNYENGTWRTDVCICMEEINPVMLKAKADFMSNIMDGVIALIEAKQIEFEEVYGRETVAHAHHNFDFKEGNESVPIIDNRKYVHSQEVQSKLLERAFPEENKS